MNVNTRIGRTQRVLALALTLVIGSVRPAWAQNDLFVGQVDTGGCPGPDTANAIGGLSGTTANQSQIVVAPNLSPDGLVKHTNRHYYFTCFWQGTLNQLDNPLPPGVPTITTIARNLNGPSGIAEDPFDHTLLVSNYGFMPAPDCTPGGGAQISVYDTNGTLLDTILFPGLTTPQSIALLDQPSPRVRRFIVTDQLSGVYLVTRDSNPGGITTGTPISFPDVPPNLSFVNPTGLAVTGNGPKIYLSTYGNPGSVWCFSFDPADPAGPTAHYLSTQQLPLPTPDGGGSLALLLDEQPAGTPTYLYVSDWTGNVVNRFSTDVSTGSISSSSTQIGPFFHPTFMIFQQ